MAAKSLSTKINDLFNQRKWEEARQILELERERDPQNHWVLTQLGVTFYEQFEYNHALKIFLASLNILNDCPLTLWNLAGTLDSLGKPDRAVEIYTWLLQSRITADEDPCWESKERTDALKADCVYRLGVCFRHLGKKPEAEHCFRQYVNLLLTGIDGTYSFEDVGVELRKIQRKKATERTELQKRFLSTLEQFGIEQAKSGQDAPPRFTERELLPGRRAASRK
jgi:tetratricopeptide (TPR) repeat protein